MNEETFILNAARVNLSEQNISTLKEISGNGMDWNLLMQIARMHGVSTFLYYSITNYGLQDMLPREVYERFKADYYTTAIRNTMLLGEFEKISELTDLKIIPLKGIDLIQSLYPSIGIRSMCDIDILIEEMHAWEIWKQIFNEKDLGLVYSKGMNKSSIHQKFINSKHLPDIYLKHYKVDIHWNLFRGNRLYYITKKAWQTSISVKRNISRLSNEFMLIYLCSHFCDHMRKASILRMLVDVNELVRKNHNMINWEEVRHVCNDPKLKDEIETALSYAYVLFDTPVPQAFLIKKVLNNSCTTVLSLLELNRKKTVKIFFQNFRKQSNPIKIAVFVFRTIAPVKEWMAEQYGITTKRDLVKVYFKYWGYLINRHLFKKDIKIGN